MPWQALPEPDLKSMPNLQADLKAKVPILVDQSLGREVTDYLRERGCNVVYAEDVGLGGAADDEVCKYAWREGRMIWNS